ncbi:MAG: hypothetical protein HQM08_17355 [Candidatus Riflebacteria bacterium]|nr:hypothetical protein [Candidatus Riflebacteria bacterium]
MNYFLPYQKRWIEDRSKLKIVEKSRRIGMTYAQSYEDVADAARADDPLDVWFSSADESAAREYIRYCNLWTQVLKVASTDLGEVVIDSDDDIKAFVIEFASGKRINALSSNPKAFRSKGGKLILDEFAFHPQPEEMWKAAFPVITWGFPARILSTYNGKGNRYYRMVEEAKKPDSKWKLHTITIEDAVREGLADRITKRKLTDEERLEWLSDLKKEVRDDDAWNQEYMCIPVDEASAWLPWDLIASCESKDAGIPGFYTGGPCFLGMDIARRRDLTIIWVDELVGDVFWTREVVRLSRASFAEQDAALERIMNKYYIVRGCMDQTGIGEKPVEDAQRKYGSRIEGVLFNGPVKQELATGLKRRYEDRQVRTPVDEAIRNAHHAVKKVMTAAGNPRFDAERTEAGHADEFWAHALSVHAGSKPVGNYEFKLAGIPRVSSRMGGW